MASFSAFLSAADFFNETILTMAKRPLAATAAACLKIQECGLSHRFNQLTLTRLPSVVSHHKAPVTGGVKVAGLTVGRLGRITPSRPVPPLPSVKVTSPPFVVPLPVLNVAVPPCPPVTSAAVNWIDPELPPPLRTTCAPLFVPSPPAVIVKVPPGPAPVLLPALRSTLPPAVEPSPAVNITLPPP